MTNEDIVQQIQQGIDVSENHERLWLQNKAFVAWEIKRTFGINENDNDFDDFMQEGFIGLITAASKYKADKGNKFLSYAEYYIRNAITRYNYNTGSNVRIPVVMREKIRKYAKYRQQFRDDKGRYPNDEEIKEHLQLTDKQLYHLQKTIYKMNAVSIDKNISEDDSESTLLDMPQSGEDIEEMITYSVYNEELKSALHNALAILDQDTRTAILNAFYQKCPIEKTAAIMKCSRQSVYARLEKGYWQILHSPHRKILEQFMEDGYQYNEYAHSEYAEIEEEDNEFLI